ncbi:protein of unknown function [Paraburkholderia kururiensis]
MLMPARAAASEYAVAGVNGALPVRQEMNDRSAASHTGTGRHASMGLDYCLQCNVGRVNNLRGIDMQRGVWGRICIDARPTPLLPAQPVPARERDQTGTAGCRRQIAASQSSSRYERT